VLFTFAHGAADAFAHPAFRAPSLKGEAMKEFRAPPRRHNNRGDDAWLFEKVDRNRDAMRLP
jgi:hypothetical protein